MPTVEERGCPQETERQSSLPKSGRVRVCIINKGVAEIVGFNCMFGQFWAIAGKGFKVSADCSIPGLGERGVKHEAGLLHLMINTGAGGQS